MCRVNRVDGGWHVRCCLCTSLPVPHTTAFRAGPTSLPSHALLTAGFASARFRPAADKKMAVVSKIAKEAGFQQYTINFLNLLIKKDRMPLLEEICESFEEQYCKLTDTQARSKS